jgi:hypothetical protein
MVLYLPPKLLCRRLGAVLPSSLLQVWPDLELLGDGGSAGAFIKVLAAALLQIELPTVY